LSLEPADQLPAFLLYAKDWLNSESVSTMTYEEKGVYIDLLCIAWTKVGLPKDEAKIARLLGLTRPAFRKIWRTIGEHWEPSGERLFNPRMEEVRKKANANERVKEIRRIQAKEAADKRWAAERARNAEAA